MKYEIIGGSFPVVECTLKSGEAMITQSGSMAYMDPTITMETSTNGGLKKVVGRLFSNEHLFQNIYTSTKDGSKIAFGTCVPGSIMAIKLEAGKSIVCQKSLDSYTSSTTPYVDPELKLIYTIGNGDSYIRAFDYSDGKIEYIQNHQLSKSNNTSILLKRRYLDKQHNEIDRFIIYTKEKNISYVSFFLPNKNLDTLRAYPNESLSKPQLSVADWVKGQNVKLIPQKVYTTQTSKDENKYPSESIRILPKKDEFVYNNNINNSNDYSEPNSENYNVKITFNSKRTSSGNIGSNNQRQQFSQQNPSLPQENFISQEEKCKILMDENKQQMSNELENLNKDYTKTVNFISGLEN